MAKKKHQFLNGLLVVSIAACSHQPTTENHAAAVIEPAFEPLKPVRIIRQVTACKFF